VALQLDRAEYFPTEIAQARLTISNNTPYPLRIPDPSHEKAAALGVWRLHEPNEWGMDRSPMFAEPDIIQVGPPPLLPPLDLAAGQSVSRLFDRHVSIPSRVGRYALMGYFGASAPFTVVPARFVTHAVLPLRREEPVQGYRIVRGKLVSYPAVRRFAQLVFAVESDGVYWVMTCLAKFPVDDRTKPGEVLDWGGTPFRGAVRVGRSEAPIAQVGGTINAADELAAVSWTDAAGRTSNVPLKTPPSVTDKPR